MLPRWCFFSVISTFTVLYRNVSRLLVNSTCMLLCVGFIMLSRPPLDKGLDKAVRQYVIVVISACLAWAIPYIMERVWQLYKLQWLYAGWGCSVLFTVYAAGNESFGAQLSLTIGGFPIQPSEFVNTFVFFTASMFYLVTDFRAVAAAATAVAAVHVLIMVLSKDLGGALIFFTTYLLMLFVATSNWFYLGLGTLLGNRGREPGSLSDVCPCAAQGPGLEQSMG